MNKTNIIITSYNNKLNKLKELNSTLSNIKIYTLNEFNRLYYFDYDEKTIYYIMNKYNVIYDIAEIYINNLYNIEDKVYKNSKLSFLTSLKKELLSNKLLYNNPLFISYIKHSKITIEDLPHTKELTNLYNSLSSITEVDIKESKVGNYIHKIHQFKSNTEEVEYIANSICTLLKNGIPASHIYLANLNDDYKTLITRIFPMFKIPFILKSDDTLFKTSLSTKFFELYKSDLKETIKELENSITNDESKDIVNKMISIINKYTFVDDKLLIKDMLKYDFKNTKLDTIDIYDAIHEVNLNDTLFTDEDYIFVLGFNQGILPTIYKDEDYLTDNDKKELNISLTIDKNNLEKEILSNKLSSIKNLTITYPLTANGESLTISSLNDILKYEIITNDEIPSCNSNLYNKLKLASLLDDFYKYGTNPPLLSILSNSYKNLPYNTYDNKYTGLDSKELYNYLNNKLTLSYSSLEKYYRCPFQYYLTKVLKLDIYEETFYQLVGTLFHAILEKYTKETSFDTLWDSELNVLNHEFTSKEEFFLTKLKKELLFIINTIEEQDRFTSLHNELHEEKIDITIDPDKNVNFTGIIDKIKYKEELGKTIVAIIDYKTGNPNLEIENIIYGLGMQLPVYLYLLKHTNKLENVEIAGLYLQKVLNNEITVDNIHTYEQLKKRNLLLQGYSNDDQDIISLFDSSYKDSNMIKGMKVKKDGSLYTKKILSTEQMNKLSNMVEERIKEGASRIINADFNIEPAYIDGKDHSCSMCKYQDICYRTNKDIRNLKKVELDKVIGGEADELDTRTVSSD